MSDVTPIRKQLEELLEIAKSAKERADNAHEHICKLAKDGAKSWRLSIPVQDDDSDVLLQAPLDLVPQLSDAVIDLITQLKDAQVEIDWFKSLAPVAKDTIQNNMTDLDKKNLGDFILTCFNLNIPEDKLGAIWAQYGFETACDYLRSGEVSQLEQRLKDAQGEIDWCKDNYYKLDDVNCKLNERIVKLEQRLKESYDKGFGDGWENGIVPWKSRVQKLEQRLAECETALKKALEFGEYAHWAIDAAKNLQQLDIDSRAYLTKWGVK